MNYDLEDLLSDPKLSETAKSLGKVVQNYLNNYLPDRMNFTDTMDHLDNLEALLIEAEEALEGKEDELEETISGLQEERDRLEDTVEELQDELNAANKEIEELEETITGWKNEQST